MWKRNSLHLWDEYYMCRSVSRGSEGTRLCVMSLTPCNAQRMIYLKWCSNATTLSLKSVYALYKWKWVWAYLLLSPHARIWVTVSIALSFTGNFISGAFWSFFHSGKKEKNRKHKCGPKQTKGWTNKVLGMNVCGWRFTMSKKKKENIGLLCNKRLPDPNTNKSMHCFILHLNRNTFNHYS